MFAYSWAVRPIFGPARYHLFIAPAYLLLLGQGLSRLGPSSAGRWRRAFSACRSP